MGVTEFILVAVGVAVFLLGYLLPAKKKDMDEEVQMISEDEIRRLIAGETEKVKDRIADIVDEAVSYSIEKTERAMERLSNEKIMAINEYSDTVLEEINKKAENYETVCQNLLEVIMICMLRNNNLSIVQSSNALLNRECTQIKHYLDANYAENITLDMLASLSHMNKYYLVHAFTKCIGISPITYLLQKRIQEGKSLLESTSYSISQISTTLGFSSQSYFSQAFRKATGMTPMQYRKQA